MFAHAVPLGKPQGISENEDSEHFWPHQIHWETRRYINKTTIPKFAPRQIHGKAQEFQQNEDSEHSWPQKQREYEQHCNSEHFSDTKCTKIHAISSDTEIAGIFIHRKQNETHGLSAKCQIRTCLSIPLQMKTQDQQQNEDSEHFCPTAIRLAKRRSLKKTEMPNIFPDARSIDRREKSSETKIPTMLAHTESIEHTIITIRNYKHVCLADSIESVGMSEMGFFVFWISRQDLIYLV